MQHYTDDRTANHVTIADQVDRNSIFGTTGTIVVSVSGRLFYVDCGDDALEDCGEEKVVEMLGQLSPQMISTIISTIREKRQSVIDTAEKRRRMLLSPRELLVNFRKTVDDFVKSHNDSLAAIYILRSDYQYILHGFNQYDCMQFTNSVCFLGVSIDVFGDSAIMWTTATQAQNKPIIVITRYGCVIIE